MSLREFVGVARDRWLWMVGGMLAGLAVALAALWATTPEYASTARIYITAPAESGGLAEAYSGSLLIQQKIGSYPGLLTGETVRAQAERELGFPVAPGRLGALVEAETSIVTATATDPVPERAAAIANTAAAAFTELIATIERVPEDDRRAAVVAQVVQPAAAPEAPASPRPTAYIGLGIGLGLLAGIAVAMLWNSLDPRIRSVAAARRAVPVPTLGVVGLSRRQRRAGVLAGADSRSPAAEAFRQVRSQLQARDVGGRYRRLVVTSAVEDEGRSVVAVNLAVAFARSGATVLLIDADLRTRLAPDVGLVDVLTGSVALADAVRAGSGGLDVLPGGDATGAHDADVLLTSPALPALLDSAAARYDVVIVDAPPVLPVTDAVSLAAHSDATILAVRVRRSTAERVREAVDQLAPVRAEVVGIVVLTRPPLWQALWQALWRRVQAARADAGSPAGERAGVADEVGRPQLDQAPGDAHLVTAPEFVPEMAVAANGNGVSHATGPLPEVTSDAEQQPATEETEGSGDPAPQG